ncbi:MAG TPA: copper resistance protein CopC [Solirubrobacter sp.]|nr:copper resistance protein CopC [Solirubrobacter sp.]
MTRRTLALITAVALLVPVSVAWAHVDLKSVSPRKNSTRTSAVRTVQATFKSSLLTGTITIKNQGGHVIQLKRNGLKAGNKRVLQAIPRTPLGSGRYTVEWRARAPDGHSQRGTWSFRVRR